LIHSLTDHLLNRGHLHIRSRRHLLRQIAHKLDDASNATRPAGLVTGSNAGSVVAVEVFVEQDVVLPIGVGLEFFRCSIDRAATVAIGQEGAG
jgi:hypothetical protein